jgi:hypothetical protein
MQELFDLNDETISNDFLYENSFKILVSCKKINITLITVIILVGFIGNCLTLFVYSQKRFRTNSSTVFLLCLALNDTLFLIVHFFEDTIRTYIDIHFNKSDSARLYIFQYFNLTSKSQFACVLFNYLRNVLRFISAFILVAFTSQRVTVTYFPLARRFKSNKSAWLTVLVIVIVGLAANLWVLGLFELNHFNDYKICELKKEMVKDYYKYTFVYVCFVILVPIVIVFAGNFLIILKSKRKDFLRRNYTVRRLKLSNKTDGKMTRMETLKNSRTKRSNAVTPNERILVSQYYLTTNQLINRITKKKNNSKVITRSLSTASIMYAILNLPYLITWLMFIDSLVFQNNLDLVMHNKFFSFSQLSDIFFMLNYAIKFYVHFLNGSVFRNQLKFSCKYNKSIYAYMCN